MAKTKGELLWSAWGAAIVRFYRWRNRGRPRILYYSDSRAVDVSSRRRKYHPLHSLAAPFIRQYDTIPLLVPHSHTTLIDFLFEVMPYLRWADVIIGHVGIVDFSPRPISGIEAIYRLKRERFNVLFNQRDLEEHWANPMRSLYQGEKTSNLYSLETATTALLPRLQEMEQLVYLGCNRVVHGWNGSYSRGRPENMNVIMDYSSALCGNLRNAVRFDTWTDAEIMDRTTDNIHYTRKGFDFVRERIVEKLNAILK